MDLNKITQDLIEKGESEVEGFGVFYVKKMKPRKSANRYKEFKQKAFNLVRFRGTSELNNKVQ